MSVSLVISPYLKATEKSSNLHFYESSFYICKHLPTNQSGFYFEVFW